MRIGEIAFYDSVLSGKQLREVEKSFRNQWTLSWWVRLIRWFRSETP